MKLERDIDRLERQIMALKHEQIRTLKLWRMLSALMESWGVILNVEFSQKTLTERIESLRQIKPRD